MYIMYVDESGDSGLDGSPAPYFVLTGLTVHESRWRDFLDQLVAFRRTMRDVHGLPMRTEIHAAEFIRSPPVPGMAKFVRLAILRNLLDELAKMEFLSITNVVVRKAGKEATYDVFGEGWKTLFQRFENTIGYGNFPGSFQNDKGLVVVDNTEGEKLQRLLRKMAVYNPIPNMAGLKEGTRNIPTVRFVEDPYAKDSRDSYFVQAADVCAFFLTQKYTPCSYVKRQGARNYFARLRPVLNTKASYTNGFGIVNL